MPTLYVSNPTKQNRTFYYRLPANAANERHPRRIEIRSGEQMEVKGNPQEIQHLITELERFGARDAAEIHGKVTGFNSLVYREDHVVSREEIELGHEQVVETQKQIAVTEATRSALAYDSAARHLEKRKRGRPAKTTQIEVEQEVPRGAQRTGDEVHLDITVDPEGRADERLPT